MMWQRPMAGDQMSAARDRRAVNRSMFWRVLRRSIFANRGRLFVILLALGAGAAVTAALLNLQVDARRRINSEFSIFGPNALISSRDRATTFSESVFDRLTLAGPLKNARANLFAVAEVTAIGKTKTPTRVVVEGTRSLEPKDKPGGSAPSSDSEPNDDRQACLAGARVASLMRLQAGDKLMLDNDGRREFCTIRLIWKVGQGSVEDNEIVTTLGAVQRLTEAPGRISLVQLSLSGTSEEQNSYLAGLQSLFPDYEVRPLRQFSEAQVKIYGKISGILTMTVVVVLLLTSLCVMAAMTNIAAERKNDVGLMKAIGGSVRRVLRIFLAEAAVLGLAAGLLGAAAGIVLSMALGKAVFGVAAQPRLVVYPVAVALTVTVAILAAYPLRRLALVRPASVFRGEE